MTMSEYFGVTLFWILLALGCWTAACFICHAARTAYHYFESTEDDGDFL